MDYGAHFLFETRQMIDFEVGNPMSAMVAVPVLRPPRDFPSFLVHKLCARRDLDFLYTNVSIAVRIDR